MVESHKNVLKKRGGERGRGPSPKSAYVNGFKKTIFGMISVSSDLRIVNVFVITPISVCLNNTHAFERCVTFSGGHRPQVRLRCPLRLSRSRDI